MTLAEIIYECGELGNQSTRVELDWKRFVNRAQRKIAQRRNFTFLHDQRQVTIQQSALHAPLDANYKCLDNEKTPVTYQDPTVQYQLPIPVEVISRARANFLAYNPFVAAYPTAPNVFPIRWVFIERDGPAGAWQIWLPTQYQINPQVTFNISAYYYPDDLRQGEDSNAMTNHPELCDAIINLAKATAFDAEGVLPDQAKQSRQLYEIAYRAASYSDMQQQFSGRALKM